MDRSREVIQQENHLNEGPLLSLESHVRNAWLSRSVVWMPTDDCAVIFLLGMPNGHVTDLGDLESEGESHTRRLAAGLGRAC